MAIAYVQKSSIGQFAGTSSTTCTLTGVTVGNTLTLISSHANFDSSGGGVSAVDGQGAYTQDSEIGGTTFTCDILRLSAANAGTHTVTVSAKFGTAVNSQGQAILVEWSGISSLDQQNGNSANSTGPVSTGASGVLANASELVICCGTVGLLETWGTPSGYTSLYQDLTTSRLATSIAYKLLSGTSAVTSNYGTLGGAANWVASQALYIPTVTGSSQNGTQMMMGMGT